MLNRDSSRISSLRDDQTKASALPPDWERAWGAPSPLYRHDLLDLRKRLESLADGIPLVDERPAFSALVSPAENAAAPVHRWYSYKEAFSFRLPREIVARFGAGPTRVVADVFAGVGTTALSLQTDPRVDRVLSLEYSPFAHFAGQAKLQWHQLSPRRLEVIIDQALKYPIDKSVSPPNLSAFSNREIFGRSTVVGLVSAREHIASMNLTAPERRFLLLGLAAVVEDVSGAMKDGRALRITRDRSRRSNVLTPTRDAPRSKERVRRELARQWTAMHEDVMSLRSRRSRVLKGKTTHVRGDARSLSDTKHGRALFADCSVGLFVYSPPYLNCIDYSEVYKLELWLLQLIRDSNQFRNLRLGTIRSHPSVEFPARDYLDDAIGSEVVECVELCAQFVEKNHARASIGRMIRHYFEDMYKVLLEQFRALAAGGYAVCVVGNSTFSGRDRVGDRYEERWRLPLLTDVMMARLGELAGFTDFAIWTARSLQPRNVNAGAARESLVVMRKP